jgi:phosphohistidine phosphatase
MATSPGRRLLLLRHAKSAWPDDVQDHERPLAPRGRRDAPAAGRWLRDAGLVPDLVLCSTARRARETWQLAAENLGADPKTVFEERVYGAASAELLDLARQTPPDVATLLIVGHDPAMQRAVLELAGAEPEQAGTAGTAGTAELDRVRAKYPTAGIAVLEFAGRGGWAEIGPGQARLTAFATPRDFGGR